MDSTILTALAAALVLLITAAVSVLSKAAAAQTAIQSTLERFEAPIRELGNHTAQLNTETQNLRFETREIGRTQEELTIILQNVRGQVAVTNSPFVPQAGAHG